MRITKPEGIVTQEFGLNPDIYDPLKGHTGTDFILNFRSSIKAVITAPVYSLLNENNPDTNKYRALYQMYDEPDSDISYEISYGHLDSFLVKEGFTAVEGQVIGTEGNWGFCFVNGIEVTPEQKKTGMGSHLHFQIRTCKRVTKKDQKKKYIRNGSGDYKNNGMFYEVIDYKNGYNGCIDPRQFYKRKPREFKIDMEYGQRNDEVKKLQEALRELGHFNSNGTGYYGDATARAVLSFQEKESISNPLARATNRGRYCYIQTRTRLNQIFAP